MGKPTVVLDVNKAPKRKCTEQQLKQLAEARAKSMARRKAAKEALAAAGGIDHLVAEAKKTGEIQQCDNVDKVLKSGERLIDAVPAPKRQKVDAVPQTPSATDSGVSSGGTSVAVSSAPSDASVPSSSDGSKTTSPNLPEMVKKIRQKKKTPLLWYTGHPGDIMKLKGELALFP